MTQSFLYKWTNPLKNSFVELIPQRAEAPHTSVGSGSLEQDGPLCIVAMEKEEQTRLVHHHRLGKRQRHADKTGQTLAQRVIPPLHMGGFSRLFAHGCVLFLRDHSRIGCPEIREAMPLAI